MTFSRIVAFITAFVLSVALTPWIQRVAIRNGVVDYPGLGHKRHTHPVAYLGGVTVFLAWLGGVFLYSAIERSGHLHDGFLAGMDAGLPIAIIFGATVITLTGLLDDVYDMTPRVKIGGQFAAAAAVAWSSQDISMSLVSHMTAAVGLPVSQWVAYILGTVLIAFLVVGGCNAVNLIDGMDGLATGTTAITTLGLLFLSLQSSFLTPSPYADAIRVGMCLAMLGALIGFLPFNFHPAGIYLGDAGSLLIGYLCMATVLLLASAQQDGGRFFAAGLICCGVPILDTSLAIGRRVLRRQPISEADREHLHHHVLVILRRYSDNTKRTTRLCVLFMYSLALVFVVLGCSLLWIDGWYVLIGGLVVLTLVGSLLVIARRPTIDRGPNNPQPPTARVRRSLHG